ncbi:hypothetical protein [Clostridium sp.]|uniref:hypothetical protein n=1 Tax=Clostridium sp. TaxID=1506 RepID=UPI0029120DC0|nr:hypothetical protein [Clostridium sp.]MDU4480194.1 hypothetical protein [Clostridium sp.]
MENLDDLMLFPNKINEIQLERAHYIELKKYSKKVYKREIITNSIVVLIILGLAISLGVTVLCQVF